MKKDTILAKPILKWAGGKTQMLKEIIPRIPVHFGKYIEPFFGGGAVFFALDPENAIIADSNPELINMYRQVADYVDEVICCLQKYENTSEMFYAVREQNWMELTPVEAAARTIYLNKTCFNGLYRVNKKGQFNTPFGKYKNPKICDEPLLREVSKRLKKATIECGDYMEVLEKYAQAGDFIFLDPPYIPVSEYGDFKRYTKEQFYEEDQRKLAELCKKLYERGCYLMLTNSNHPLVHEMYRGFDLEVVPTKRAISSKGSTRRGEDVIVTAYPSKRIRLPLEMKEINDQTYKYPPTRFMGSKSKLLDEIWSVASCFEFDSVLDLFSGSGIVGYMFKSEGKKVISNDYMSMSAIFTKAMIENNDTTITKAEMDELFKPNETNDNFVEKTFKDLYFTDEENRVIDTLRANIWQITDEYKRAIAIAALIRACTKKRPRGIFTYTGSRYDDGRKDLQLSIEEQFRNAVEAINAAVFDNGKNNRSICGDAMDVDDVTPDLVYIDPPYYSKHSDNEYVRRYHFIEGIARDWKGVEIQEHTKTKKFKSYPTPFSTRNGATEAFDELFRKYKDSIIIVSYSSNCLPNQDEMIQIMKEYKENVEVVPIDYKYFFGNQSTAKTNRNNVQEFLFVGF